MLGNGELDNSMNSLKEKSLVCLHKIWDHAFSTKKKNSKKSKELDPRNPFLLKAFELREDIIATLVQLLYHPLYEQQIKNGHILRIAILCYKCFASFSSSRNPQMKKFFSEEDSKIF